MEPREHLKDMLTNLIKGKDQDATAAVHQYIVQKSQELAQRPPKQDEED